ncbi:ribosomal RNA-processing protein 14-C-like [Momordica charantia]|uniref:Ribosomal RNA-processing protein 14-C-like n=1 Tax=Momordica charantia TaxID=3673 RepID=A0A6J1CA47_MOMCH|nr:ribosomal RNA-processing protein 14-C-like [Momordica charantia]XP_022138582.1 ribosomal RNA-processing protein 14-C-like [Momordica charantia]
MRMAPPNTEAEVASSSQMKMKKKKKQKTVGDSNSGADLKSIIHQHALFFDKLVELIPARFYLPNDEKDKPWFQGLSKTEKVLAKKESKENLKKARRDRMDPEKYSKSTLDLLKQSLEKEKLKNESDDEEKDVKPMTSGLDDDERSVTYEELRQRLHRKLEEFRANRNTGCSNREKKRNERNERWELVQKKRKREVEPEEKKSATSTTRSTSEVERSVVEASKKLAFSHVKLGTEEENGKKKKRRLSKLKELENAKRLEEAKKDPEKGETISKKHSWKAATSRAAGDKVHDDPKLLMKSLRKEKKQQLKNVEKWKERIETTQKMKAERQQKRSKNIAHKIHDKKMRRIAKREKKLMRPGFEGRKEGFINEGTA